MKKENLSRYDSEVWSDNSKNCEQCKDCIFRFYNLFWGAKVTVQMRVLSAPTFFSIKK